MGDPYPEATADEARRRERRRAAQRARRAMTGGLSWNVTGAILGAVIGSVVGYTVQGWTGAAVAAGVGGALGAMLGPLLVLGTLFAWYFATYRHRFIDEEWSAEHEDSIPGTLMLALRRRAGPAMESAIDECWVRTDGPWVVIKNRDLPWVKDRIWYPYHDRHELEPGRTYEVRWFRIDGGQFAELARETFRLRRHNQ
jgi:hypothetical protein